MFIHRVHASMHFMHFKNGFTFIQRLSKLTVFDESQNSHCWREKSQIIKKARLECRDEHHADGLKLRCGVCVVV